MSEPLKSLKENDISKTDERQVALANSRVELLKFMKTESGVAEIVTDIRQGCQKV